MPRKSLLAAAAALCLVLAALPASARTADSRAPYEKAIALARHAIWKEITGGQCGSATAAIMVEGKLVYAEGFGMADRARSIPVDAATLFNIGSISKVYVAAAIMLLVDDGRVSLDRPVSDYLPEFRMADERYRKITVRMLLNHTSGLPGTQGANAFGFVYDGHVTRETLDTLARAHLKHDPGAMAVYCNDGFTLAELVVERVSKKRYLDFLAERIFKPLGLKNTGSGVGEMKGRPVARYYDPKTGKIHPAETLSILGAGGLSATAEDVCRFADLFSAKGRLLKRASRDEMRKAQPSSFQGLRDPTMAIGLGWDMTGFPRYDAAGLQVLGKSGGTGNYSSMVYTVPDKRISVAVIASGPHSGAMKIALDILDAVLVGRKLLREEEKAVAVPPEPQELPKEAPSFGGYYGGGTKLGRLVFDPEKRMATLFAVEGQEEKPVEALLYRDGYYHDPEGDRSYFIDLGGQTYWVNRLGLDRIDTIALQKVKPLEKPLGLRIDMDNRIWLRRNVSPYEAAAAADSHLAKSWLPRELPGYVFFWGLKRIDSPDFAGMPFDALRDQTELTLLDKNGATWAWASDMLYSPAEGAAALAPGERGVTIGPEGYCEWLAAQERLVLSFAKPRRGRVIVFSPDDTVTYDSAIDTGDAYVARGGYVELAGLAGDRFTLKARPAAEKTEK